MSRPPRSVPVIAIAVLIVLVAQTASVAASGGFVDTVSSVHRADIERIAHVGITRGCNPPTNSRYCPEDDVTRGQMASFLTRALQLPAAQERFRDVNSDHTHAAAIGSLAAAGITAGCNPPVNDRFCPDEPVTRAQLASFLERGLDLTRMPEGFRDVATRSVHAQTIGALAFAGITAGCNPPVNDRFCPDDRVTRAEMATFIARSLDRLGTMPGDWVARVPVEDQVGRRWTASPDKYYALRARSDVRGVTAIGGESAAIVARADDITISESLLGGANDGLKPADGTTLRDSVVGLDYGPGAHADHVQVNGDDRVTISNVRFIAENAGGATFGGWNAAVFIHDGSTDWRIRNAVVQAGRPSLAIRSWYPIRLYSGRGSVNGLVIDRETMRGSTAVHVKDAQITGWSDVYIREPDGRLTPVPDPRS